MKTSKVDVEIPEEIFNALQSEAESRGISLEELKTSILCAEVCVTSVSDTSAA